MKHEGNFVLNRNGTKIKVVGGWGQNGSDSSMIQFINAINNIFINARCDFDYQFAEESSFSYPIGNPTTTAVFFHFVTGMKRKLSSVFVSAAKHHLTPFEYLKTIERLIQDGRYEASFVMLGVMFRLQVSLGFRFADAQNLKYGDFVRELCRLEPELDTMRSIGVRLSGKCENLASNYQRWGNNRKTHYFQIHRNR